MDDLDYCHLMAQLTRYEGFRLRHYQDTAGKLTAAKQPPIRAVRADAVATTLERDLRRIATQLEDQWPRFRKLDPVRQRVLLHMSALEPLLSWQRHACHRYPSRRCTRLPSL